MSLIYAINPTTCARLEPGYPSATPDEVDDTVQRAAEAFQQYRDVSEADRAQLLEAMADQIMALGEALIDRCHQETGLPRARLEGERGRTCQQLRFFAGVVREGSWLDARIARPDPDRLPAPRPDLRLMLRPLGAVGVFGASNFPLAFSVAGGDTASALAAGCTVVVKAHPAHPGTSALVAGAVSRAVAAAGLPAGTFALLHGGIDVGMALVQHPQLRAVGFTGSFQGGKALTDAAAQRPDPIPVYAEMGSSNPVFVLPAALQRRGDAIARGLAQSVTLGAGQFCTNPGVTVLMRSEAAETFLATAARLLRETPPAVMLTPAIHRAYHEGVTRLLDSPGVEKLAAGASHPGLHATPHWLRTTVANALRQPQLTEEVFGPASLAVVADHPEEVYQFARRMEGHLTASLHAEEEDLRAFPGLVDLLAERVGRLVFNGFPTGVEVSPAMMHGGPFPATSDGRSTSVGGLAIRRFARPVCYQDCPAGWLPVPLRDENPTQRWRQVDGAWTQASL